ncbi:CDP-glycerol glycerophosphotransferase family protein [Porticoccaceae bacterium]|jgi:CDP-glycerol glycerophosphotransferase (TagB/SpsB family)|nr:CDP-glycerol glycerophosphotransferase family protein [Porticoccaceae bacterium]
MMRIDKKGLKSKKSKGKIPLLMLVLSYLLRPLMKKKSVFCFVATHKKPWGCNLEAYFLSLQASQIASCIYILNFGTTSNEVIINETSQLDANVAVIDRTDTWQLFKCVCLSELFFMGDYSSNWLPGKKINLWHGIPLKKIGVLQTPKYKKLAKRFNNVISAASKLDQNNMAQAFNMGHERILPFGLPRHDWIAGDLTLPVRFNKQLEDLDTILAGRKLILYAPTFRDKNRNGLALTDNQLKIWADCLKQQGCVLGMRLHTRSGAQLNFDELGVLDLSSEKFNHIEAIYRKTEILVTDYSSVSIDFMLTNKVIIGLDPSGDRYERGFIGDFNLLFPGHFFNEFDVFLDYLKKIIHKPQSSEVQFDYSFQRRLFLGSYDNNACRNLTNSLFD